ncbi:hypothetical protein [Sinomicrobium weinanense]|uniref:SPOR domain-containing protein n=1 Tax=Sinomicrobium weinanense TaxID=2842200 RepID=A0A926Q1I4_9FLAO|nr:hypothetical protein [Sinomicrobium weinanense]MBC9794829.1 hypothetical protein [Sinomicrobium weinanense]MBU3125600.1 hypothetical protein [Sinomicrobium weinanense]
MPYIEEEDLVALHKKIEREQESNKKLLDQISSKNNSYDKSVKMKNTAWGITSALCLAIIGFAFYFNSELTAMEASYASCYEKNSLLLKSVDSTSILKERVASLESENKGLRKDLDEASTLPVPDTVSRDSVYTVQIRAFETDQIPLQSNTNFIYAQNNNLFYAFCIGIFDNPDDARTLKRELTGMGFDDAFVALYKDGKRKKIIED